MNYCRVEIIQAWGRILLLSIVFLLSFHIFADKVLAQTNPTCPSVYGAACPSGQIFIDKKVQNPKSGEFVEALSTSDITFAPDQEVNFRIEVKNTGSSDISNIFVQDRLPGNVNFFFGPGSFDKNANILSWTIDKIAPNESKFFLIKLKVKPQNELQFDIACMTNFVQAQKDQQMAQDTSVFCIQTQSLKVAPPPEEIKQLPKTGPEGWLLTLFGSIVGLIVGNRLVRVGKVRYDMVRNDFRMTENRIKKKEGGEVN